MEIDNADEGQASRLLILLSFNNIIIEFDNLYDVTFLNQDTNAFFDFSNLIVGKFMVYDDDDDNNDNNLSLQKMRKKDGGPYYYLMLLYVTIKVISSQIMPTPR